MRMRKKKHTDDRMIACGEILINNPAELLGKWQEKSGGKPIFLEIGCGKGTFVCETAKRNPDKFFVAVEKVRDVMVMAMEKCVAAELKNVVFADIDAAKLGEVFAEGELSGIYLNFSDPWPKKKHAKRRLLYYSYRQTCYNRGRCCLARMSGHWIGTQIGTSSNRLSRRYRAVLQSGADFQASPCGGQCFVS